jgi:enoyl-[acyl-carrier-protein] reductase (NADH)
VACFRGAFADRLQESNERALDRQFLKARIEARAVAKRAQFLFSDSAGMISGQNIAIDGSW